MFLAGVSTRRVGEVIQPLLGFEVCATTVSSICKSLDREVQKFHEPTLGDTFLYLFLDGITLKARSALEVRKRIILCAYGIKRAGTRALISFRRARSESEDAWCFLCNLYARGLKGKQLKLVVVDGVPVLPRHWIWSIPIPLGSAVGFTKCAVLQANSPRRNELTSCTGSKLSVNKITKEKQ